MQILKQRKRLCMIVFMVILLCLVHVAYIYFMSEILFKKSFPYFFEHIKKQI